MSDTPRDDPRSVDPTKGFFDEQAEKWDESHTAAATIDRIAAVGDLMELQSGQELLEVGCGTGVLTAWLADRVGAEHVTAVDFSRNMIEKARVKGIGAEFRVADVCADDLGSERYDVVLCFHSFPHFRDQQAALNRIAAALKPEGRLIVMHLRGRSEINAFHDEIGGPVAGHHLPDVDAFDSLLARAGLERTELVDREGLYFLEARRAG